jgi:hypothetical protein
MCAGPADGDAPQQADDADDGAGGAGAPEGRQKRAGQRMCCLSLDSHTQSNLALWADAAR